MDISEDATQNVVELVNMTPKMIGEDIEETKLPKGMLGMFSTTHQEKISMSEQPLLTQSLSRGVALNCFGSSKFESSLAIVGSPGIGKSWTLLYALQQALLYDRACVVFFQQKSGKAYLCFWKEKLLIVLFVDCIWYAVLCQRTF
jgi:hypothetical protein